MRVVFMGTPQFAVDSLVALSDLHDVAGVFTRPDAASGRGRELRPSPVKAEALSRGIPVFQPATLKSDEVMSALAELAPGVIVVAAYGLILPGAVLGVAPLGAINVHASLLPRWRGAAPIQRAILAGDAVTGVSIMRMEEGLDTGPYLMQARTPIGDAGAVELTCTLAALGARALLEALDLIETGGDRWTPQDDSAATYAEKVTKGDLALEPGLTTEQAWRRVRAALPAAPCRASIAGRDVTITAARPAGPSADRCETPGGVSVTGEGIALGTADGALFVERLKPSGKSEMNAADWARGIRDLGAARWSEVS